MRSFLSFHLYALVSFVSAMAMVLYAYSGKHQFYSTVVHLLRSKFSALVLGNFALVSFLSITQMLRAFFFGALRRSESEMLWESVGYLITETCLALTIFRNELTAGVCVSFACLLGTKTFHWLAAKRIKHMDETENVGFGEYIKMNILCVLMISTDLFAILSNFDLFFNQGRATIDILFGFEYTLLLVSAFSTGLKFLLYARERYVLRGRWYNKSLYELYIQLIVAVIQMFVYFAFFGVVFNYYGLPFYMLRQLYLSFNNVNQKLMHFVMFRKVTKTLNKNFLNASQEDLEGSDNICIICREEMKSSAEENVGLGVPKKLPCGHIFHFYCLRNWFERQLKCPTCRSDAIKKVNEPNTRPHVAPRRPEMARNIPQQPVANQEVRREENRNDRPDTEVDANGRPYQRRNMLNRSVEQQQRGSRSSNEVYRNRESRSEGPELRIDSIKLLKELAYATELSETPHFDSLIGHKNKVRIASPMSVTETIQQQIELTRLQLQVYQTQLEAAEATRRAAEALQNVNNLAREDRSQYENEGS